MFESTQRDGGKLVGAGEPVFRIEADMVFTAIGQRGDAGRARTRRRPTCKAARSSSTTSGARALPNVWAGGDCVAGGQDLTVSAVEDGKRRGAIDRRRAAASSAPETDEGRHG